MNLKMGDLVIRRNESPHLLFQVEEFDGDYVILKGIEVPVITIATREKLIKLNRGRIKSRFCLKRVK